jgi:hypothetical protein
MRNCASGRLAPSRNDVIAERFARHAIASFPLFAALLAGGIPRVALGLLLGFESGLALGLLLLLTDDARSLGDFGLFLAAPLFGLGGLALPLHPLAVDNNRLAIGAPFGHFGVIMRGLGAEFV